MILSQLYSKEQLSLQEQQTLRRHGLKFRRNTCKADPANGK